MNRNFIKQESVMAPRDPAAGCGVAGIDPCQLGREQGEATGHVNDLQRLLLINDSRLHATSLNLPLCSLYWNQPGAGAAERDPP